MYGYLPGEDWSLSTQNLAVDCSAAGSASKAARNFEISNSPKKELLRRRRKSSVDAIVREQQTLGNIEQRISQAGASREKAMKRKKQSMQKPEILHLDKYDRRAQLLLPLLRAIAKIDIEAQLGVPITSLNLE